MHYITIEMIKSVIENYQIKRFPWNRCHVCDQSLIYLFDTTRLRPNDIAFEYGCACILGLGGWISMAEFAAEFNALSDQKRQLEWHRFLASGAKFPQMALHIEGVDPQVMLAAADLSKRQQSAPEWVWHEDRTYKTTYGRWPKDSSQVPYIRADLVLSLLRTRHQPLNQTEGTD